jgi:DNA (cytosine-5)-methyltransferase 1
MIKTHLGLFEGIGGFSLAAKWMGWETLAWCEWNEFGQKVLRHHFPNADGFGDITKTDFKKYANRIDILTGGFPCQPFSMAGKRKGTNDERYLWGEMLRAIQEVKPKYVIAENVFGITNIDGGLVFEQVCLDLEAEGYEVQPFIIPAAAKNAPHRRDRCWFIATNTVSIRLQQCKNRGEMGNRQKKICGQRSEFTNGIKTNGKVSDATNTYGTPTQCRNCKATEGRKDQGGRTEPLSFNMEWKKFPTQPPICGGDDGLPTELDGITFPKWRTESIKAYGNAIVPQIAFELFKQLEKIQ